MNSAAALLSAQQGTVEKEALLGRILWYSVPTATCLDPKIVADKLKDLGLTRRIPGLPAESNVFRRVTADAERHGIPVDGSDDKFENVMVRPVNAKKDNTLVRRIVVETVDPSGRRLDYEQVVDIEFTYDATVIPNKGVMHVQWINGFTAVTHPRAAEVIDEIRSEFDRWKGMFDDGKMRHFVKQTIIEFGATSVRPTGGIYFLEEKYAGQVESLETFINDLFPPGAECHSVEIPDTRKQREMVKRAIEAETTGAIEAMMVEVSEIKAEGSLTPKQLVAMLGKVKKLEQKMGNYSRLLETDMKAIENRTRLLKGMVSGLEPLQQKATRKRKSA